VSDCLDPLTVQQLHAGFQDSMRRGFVAETLRPPASLQHRFAIRVFDGQVWFQTDALDLSPEPGGPAVDVVNSEFDAG
jgi:hypothetical protein